MKMKDYKNFCSSQSLPNLRRGVIYLKICLKSVYQCGIHLWTEFSWGSPLWSALGLVWMRWHLASLTLPWTLEEMIRCSAAESSRESLTVCFCWASVTCFVVASKALGWFASHPVTWCEGKEKKRVLFLSLADEPIHDRKPGMLYCLPLRYRHSSADFD